MTVTLVSLRLSGVRRLAMISSAIILYRRLQNLCCKGRLCHYVNSVVRENEHYYLPHNYVVALENGGRGEGRKEGERGREDRGYNPKTCYWHCIVTVHSDT
jgi:hypothetical protein